MFGLQVLESCVKHCGNPIHDEIGTKQYMEQLRDLVKSTSHDDVKNKVLELIQPWAYAFRNSPKYRAVQENISGSPNLQQVVPEDDVDPELARYLNRSYWEQRQSEEAQQHEKQLHHVSDRNGSRVDSPLSQQPSAPMSSTTPSNKLQHRHENGETDTEMEEFVATLKMQVEIFVNRMKSNSSRGRSIANDSSVQTLFMNITAMHSCLLKHIQQQDDSRVYYEELQDKLAQVKDARAALDALREEYREKLRRQAEEAERIRQMQMAHKLEIMRKKKQEYLQYQRQLALQKIQEQEREMQMRQEQQKQQYLMGSSIPYNMQPPYMPGHGPGFGPASTDGSPVHGSQYTAVPGPNSFTSLPPATTSAGLPAYRDYSGLYSVPNMQGPPGQGQIPGGPLPPMPQGPIPAGVPPGAMHGLPRGPIPNPMMPMAGQMHGPPRPIHNQGPPIQGPQIQGQVPAQLLQGAPQVQGGPMQLQRPPQIQGQGPHSIQGQGPPPHMQSQGPQQIPGQGSHSQLQSQGPPPQMQGPPSQAPVPQNQQVPGQPMGGAQGPPASHYQQGGAIVPPGGTQPPQGPAPGSPQQQQPQQQQTAELISFD